MTGVTWEAIGQAINRPYRVTTPMVVLVLLVPLYLVIADRAAEGTPHAPALAVDGLIPLVPAWALVYGALYGFLIVLPVIVIQQEELIRRVVWAYLTVWIVSYICFLLYPTVAPRGDLVTGEGFGAWGLQFLYDSDPPYNCFPSIHVAHSFVSAFACSRVNRALGIVALACATLVAVSTLFTKQHYFADLIAGLALAMIANLVFLRSYVRENVPEGERRIAPALALCVGAVAGIGVAGFWLAYRVSGGS